MHEAGTELAEAIIDKVQKAEKVKKVPFICIMADTASQLKKVQSSMSTAISKSVLKPIFH